MTTVTYLGQRRPAGQHLTVGLLLQWLASPFARMLAASRRRKTERMLEGLPQEIRKDIGWPTTVGK
jgi:hypothetical protein